MKIEKKKNVVRMTIFKKYDDEKSTRMRALTQKNKKFININ